MAGAAFNLDGNAMDQFIRDMKDFHTNISKEVDFAKGHAADLAGGMKGPAGAQLQNSFKDFCDAAARMNDTLLLNAENLDSANKKYDHVEQDQLGDLKKAGGLLHWQP